MAGTIFSIWYDAGTKGLQKKLTSLFPKEKMHYHVIDSNFALFLVSKIAFFLKCLLKLT